MSVYFIVVRYPRGYKGYHLYDLAKCTFFVCWDVIFNENIFPFQNLPQDESDLDPFHNFVIPTSFLNNEFVGYGCLPIIALHIPALGSNSQHDHAPACDHNVPVAASNSSQSLVRRSSRPHKPPRYL